MDTNFHQKQAEEQKSITGNEAKTELEFATSDEMLRYDAEKNPPPPEIAERLNESLAKEPKLGTSFWTKLGFRKG